MPLWNTHNYQIFLGFEIQNKNKGNNSFPQAIISLICLLSAFSAGLYFVIVMFLGSTCTNVALKTDYMIMEKVSHTVIQLNLAWEYSSMIGKVEQLILGIF